MRALKSVPVVIGVLLAVSGCGGDTSPTVTSTASPGISPTAEPSATPIVTPSDTPTATPPADPHPPLAGLQITTRGLLPLTHTDPIVGNAGEQMLFWDEDNCYSEDMGITEDTGRWIANPAYYPGNPFLVDGQSDGIVRRIDVFDSGISTPEGVHVGTTTADLLATYPEIITGTPGFETDLYWIVDVHGIVVFETGTGTRDGGPGPDQVWFIRILSTEWDPDWTVYASGNVAGACF